MALSPEDLEQIRQVVRNEIQQITPPATPQRILPLGCLVLLGLALGVLALHVLVIGGFSLYYFLNHPAGH
jgi:hypothetical protein